MDGRGTDKRWTDRWWTGEWNNGEKSNTKTERQTNQKLVETDFVGIMVTHIHYPTSVHH